MTSFTCEVYKISELSIHKKNLLNEPTCGHGMIKVLLVLQRIHGVVTKKERQVESTAFWRPCCGVIKSGLFNTPHIVSCTLRLLSVECVHLYSKLSMLFFLPSKAPSAAGFFPFCWTSDHIFELPKNMVPMYTGEFSTYQLLKTLIGVLILIYWYIVYLGA